MSDSTTTCIYKHGSDMHPDAAAEIKIYVSLNNHFLARDHDITFNLGHCRVFPPIVFDFHQVAEIIN